MQCQNCQKETKNPKFCSLKCKAVFCNNLKEFSKQKEYFCTKCNLSLGFGWSKKTKYCKECYKLFSGNYVDYSQVTLKDYFDKYPASQVHAKIREKARSQLKKKHITKCQKCEYSIFIECCHIKPINKFDRNSSIAEVNHIDNLIGLCPNCHYELDNGLFTIKQNGGGQELNLLTEGYEPLAITECTPSKRID